MKNQNILIINTSFMSFILLLLFLSNCTSDDVKVNDNENQIITSWNELVMTLAIEEDKLLTLKGLRTEAMMHTAMHNALNAIDSRYMTFSFTNKNSDANPNAAVAQAAYTVSLSQYPDKKDELDNELVKWLSKIPDGNNKTLGLNLGLEAAEHILKERADDDWNGEASYSWHPMAPGVYAEFNEHSGTPEGFVFGAGWGAAKPFMLESQDQFRSPPPPSINSNDYTTAFNEVKNLGSYNSKARTDDQEHLALWWKDFVENSHNRLARDLVKKEKLDLWETARLFALLNMTIYDAYINVFNNKFHYNHWRPYTAIRWAENDTNPNTIPDTEWNNLHKHTYAFPSYPSAHGTASTAAMTVLANTLGKGDQYSFVMVTKEVDEAGPFSDKLKLNPPTRSFNSFSEAGLEASLSRIYLGIHFRYDSEEGNKLGKKIGDYANSNYLIPF